MFAAIVLKIYVVTIFLFLFCHYFENFKDSDTIANRNSTRNVVHVSLQLASIPTALMGSRKLTR